MLDLGSRLNRGHWAGWVFWGFAALFFFYEFFVRVLPSVILPELAQEFRATPLAISASLAAYLWVYAPMQLVVGGLFDRFGAKLLLVGAAATCGLGSVIFANAMNLDAVSLGRALAGLGSAFAFVGAVYVATVWFPPSRLALIAGITTAVGILGEMIGQTPMVDAVQAFGWRRVVFVAGGAGIAYAIALLVVLPRRPIWFHERFNADEETEIGIIQGTLRTLKLWPIWGLGIVSAVLYLPLSVFAAMWGNTFMEVAGGYTVEETSFATIMLAAGWLVGSPVMGVLSDRLQSRKLPLIVGTIGGGAAMLLLLWPSLFGYEGLLVLLFVGGVFTSSQVICFAASMEVCPKALRGTATACCNLITMLAAAGIQMWIGWALTAQVARPKYSIAHPAVVESSLLLKAVTATEFRWAIAVIPALFLVALLVCAFLPETAPRTDGQVRRKADQAV